MEIPKVFQLDFLFLKVHLYILDLIFRNKKTNENNEKRRIMRTPTNEIMKKGKTCTQKFSVIFYYQCKPLNMEPPMRTKSTSFDNQMCLEAPNVVFPMTTSTASLQRTWCTGIHTFAWCLCTRPNSGNLGMLSGNHVNYVQRPHVQV